MELYVLSKNDLSILSICKLADYQINLDEETNAKSTFELIKTNGLVKDNFLVLNGLYKQFLFIIDEVQTEKDSNKVTVTALDISNIFDRKVIEKNTDTMTSNSIEEFIANTMFDNFVNSNDPYLNVGYIDIYWHTNTQGVVATNSENGIYNFHTFLTNCRQYKNIFTDYTMENLGHVQTKTGKSFSVNAKNRKVEGLTFNGESIQSGSPTPDNPVNITNISGIITLTILNSDETQQQSVSFPLSSGQKLYEGSYLADDGIHNKRKEFTYSPTIITNFYNLYSNVNTVTINKQTDDIKYGNIDRTKTVLSNKLEYSNVPNGYNDANLIDKIYDGGNNVYFLGLPKTVTSITSARTYIKDLDLEYELAEEEIIPYTTEQQTAWNNIKNIILYEGINNFNANANIKLEYFPLEPVGNKMRLKIDIENKEENIQLIDTTLPEVTDYNKIYENDVTAKVTVLIREDNSEYNLYLKNDRTTTTNQNDPDRVSGKIEVISVDTADMAPTEALNVMKGNTYKHLVEFKIAKTSKVMDITKLHIGTPIIIKTEDDIYDSYISALTLSDENFVYFKSGSLRATLLDKLKIENNTTGNKLDVSGGVINGNVRVNGSIYMNGNKINTYSTNEVVVGTWINRKAVI